MCSDAPPAGNGPSGGASDAALDGPQPDGSSSPRQPVRSHGAARGGDGSARRTLGVQSLDIGMLTRAEVTAADGSSPQGPDADASRYAAWPPVRRVRDHTLSSVTRERSGARDLEVCCFVATFLHPLQSPIVDVLEGNSRVGRTVILRFDNPSTLLASMWQQLSE